jgi:4-hydroxy-tetrahydrodipicolinate synthase
MFAEGNPAGAKAYMTELGIIDNNLRLPMVKVSDSLLEIIKADM